MPQKDGATISLLALALASLSLFEVARAAAGSTCFYPNGAIHDKGSSCDPDADVSHCCEGTHTCLSNGLCWDLEFNHVIRGMRQARAAMRQSQDRPADLRQFHAQTLRGVHHVLNTALPMIPIKPAVLEMSDSAARTMSIGCAGWTQPMAALTASPYPGDMSMTRGIQL